MIKMPLLQGLSAVDSAELNVGIELHRVVPCSKSSAMSAAFGLIGINLLAAGFGVLSVALATAEIRTGVYHNSALLSTKSRLESKWVSLSDDWEEVLLAPFSVPSIYRKAYDLRDTDPAEVFWLGRPVTLPKLVPADLDADSGFGTHWVMTGGRAWRGTGQFHFSMDYKW